jgi:hypothetical protein
MRATSFAFPVLLALLAAPGCGSKATPGQSTPTATPDAAAAAPPPAPTPDAAPEPAPAPDAATAAAEPPPAGDMPKNLQVMPKTMTTAQVKDIMKQNIAPALGVKCDFCHDTNDFAKDTEHKEIARSMMLMTIDINQKSFKGEWKVTCMTCHDGKKEPRSK